MTRFARLLRALASLLDWRVQRTIAPPRFHRSKCSPPDQTKIASYGPAPTLYMHTTHPHTHTPTPCAHLVMRALNAKQIILQVAPTLCQLQELLVVVYGAVKVRHDRTGDVCTSCLKYVQDFKRGSLTSPGMDDERGTCSVSCVCVRREAEGNNGWRLCHVIFQDDSINICITTSTLFLPAISPVSF